MRAIVLAAGLSSRLRPLTQAVPKCLLPVRGRSIAERQLDLLRRAGVDDVVFVTGYAAEKVEAALAGRARFRRWPRFAETGNLLTLHSCRDLLDRETTVLFSDLLVTPRLMDRCVRDPSDFALLIDAEVSIPGTMRARLAGDAVVDLGTHIPPAEGHGTFIGAAKFTREGAALLGDALAAAAADGRHVRSNYTDALAALAQGGTALRAVRTAGEPWIEIDTPEDYRDAQIRADALCPDEAERG